MKKEAGFESIAKWRIEQGVPSIDNPLTKGELIMAAKFCLSLDSSQWPRALSKQSRDKIRQMSLEERHIAAGAYIAMELDRMRELDDWDFNFSAERYKEWDKLDDFVKKHEEHQRQHYSGTVIARAFGVLNRYEVDAAKSHAAKLKMVEDMKLYIRSMCMAAEMVGLASTHGEKAARLRGMIELMNNTAAKLEENHHDELLHSWCFSMYGRSDFPYRGVLDKYEEMKRENQWLKDQIADLKGEKREEPKELPF